MTLTLGSLLRGFLLTNAAAAIVYFIDPAAAVLPPFEVADYFTARSSTPSPVSLAFRPAP